MQALVKSLSIGKTPGTESSLSRLGRIKLGVLLIIALEFRDAVSALLSASAVGPGCFEWKMRFRLTLELPAEAPTYPKWAADGTAEYPLFSSGQPAVFLDADKTEDAERRDPLLLLLLVGDLRVPYGWEYHGCRESQLLACTSQSLRSQATMGHAFQHLKGIVLHGAPRAGKSAVVQNVATACGMFACTLDGSLHLGAESIQRLIAMCEKHPSAWAIIDNLTITCIPSGFAQARRMCDLLMPSLPLLQ